MTRELVQHAATPRLRNLMEQLLVLSNWSKDKSKPNHKIYGSFHLPQFTYTFAKRNTLERLKCACVPQDLTGVRILELASNVGAISLELANRGAEVVGLEYNSERCSWANQLATELKLKAEFRPCDLDQPVWPVDGTFDMVICCAVDHYLKDKIHLYQKLNTYTDGVLFFEANDAAPEAHTKQQIIDWFARSFDTILFQKMFHKRRAFVMGKAARKWEILPWSAPHNN